MFWASEEKDDRKEDATRGSDPASYKFLVEN